MEIYTQSKKIHMIIVPPGEMKAPRYLALSRVQLSFTSDLPGAYIQLRSKEDATMNA